jgi:putative ABC transport system substrate-binding protein
MVGGGAMRRRDFIAGIGSAAVLCPLTGFAQQAERVRRIGVLLPSTVDDRRFQAFVEAFEQGLIQLGWDIGRTVQIDIRWTSPNTTELGLHATELIALAPDVILTHGAQAVGSVRRVTDVVPIVFPVAADPVGAGIVDSMARPGGNATGFGGFEYSLGGKWLELLKEIAPNVTRAAVLRDPANPSGPAMFGIIQSVASPLRVEVNPINMRSAHDIEDAVVGFARSPNGGLIVTASGLANIHRNLMIALAAGHKLPAVYFERSFVSAGGLMSYGPDFVDQYRRAASYVDRILKGEKAANLPVQAPTKYELAINLKTSKALGITVPPALLARADELIE